MPFISSLEGNIGPIGRSRKPFNLATGGNSVTDVSNYNGTGQLWRVHRFTSSGSFNVISGLDPFRILVVGGGGGGDLGGGGSGGVVNNLSLTIPSGAQTITVGAAVGVRGTGNSSSIGSLAVAGGGQPGTATDLGGGAWNGTGGASGSPSSYAGGPKPHPEYFGPGGSGAGAASGYYPGAAFQSNITGSNAWYAEGGAGGWTQNGNHGILPPAGIGGQGGQFPTAGATNTGSGGGGGKSPDRNGAGGGSGIVIIAYRIG